MEWIPIVPVVWKYAEVNDSIEGVLVKVIPEGGKYDSPIYHLESKEGQFVVFGTAVLNDRMGYFHVGEDVKIVYKGTEKNEKKQDVKMFDVFRGKPDKEPIETAQA